MEELIPWIIALAAVGLLVGLTVSGTVGHSFCIRETGGCPTPTPSPEPVLALNDSCVGHPNFTGTAASRIGQDCTGNGEFQDDFFCNTYPPVGYSNANLSLYCAKSGAQVGLCCRS